MSIQTLINRPCQIIHRDASSTIDDYGDEIPMISIVETVCEIQQRQRTEPSDQGETSITEWVAFFLPRDSVHTGDAVVVEDETYEVIGEPWRARHPLARTEHHIEATVKRTAGAHDEVGS